MVWFNWTVGSYTDQVLCILTPQYRALWIQCINWHVSAVSAVHVGGMMPPIIQGPVAQIL